MTADTAAALRRVADALREVARTVELLTTTDARDPDQTPASAEKPTICAAPPSRREPTARSFGQGIETNHHQPEPEPEHQPQTPRPTRPAGSFDGEPTTGASFYLWAKDQEQLHNCSLVKEMTSWAKRRGYGHKFSDFNRSQVQEAYEEACRRIDQIVY